jgi:hypothetical protein
VEAAGRRIVPLQGEAQATKSELELENLHIRSSAKAGEAALIAGDLSEHLWVTKIQRTVRRVKEVGLQPLMGIAV